ncbi:MAG: NAD(P)/FAD-dependent oxidoreductase [Chloroflexi bacterium]|nr:NAD(P)/FAD-dependent oxidoreductase [Chloroflexota bacterium]
MAHDPDVVVIGAGPNGLTAAATLARDGLRVLVLDAGDDVGGAVRTREHTLPGFKHDPFSAFYPLAPVGPIGQLPLERFGLEWCTWHRPYGGGTPGGRGVAVQSTLEGSALSFDRAHPGDGAGWRELCRWWQWGGSAFCSGLFNPLGYPAPLLRVAPLLREPRRLLEFAQITAGSARALGERFFEGEEARVWLAGSVLHADLAPEDAVSGGFGLLLCALAQEHGMPIPRGGAQALSNALAAYVESLGGTILTGQRVQRLVVRDGRVVAVRTGDGEYAAPGGVLSTVEPQSLFLDLVEGGHLSPHFLRQVQRYRWGTGVFQMDVALSGLPQFQGEGLQDTLLLHLGDSLDELTRGVAAARRGVLPEHPLLVAGLHTLADPSRAPAGQHTLWLMTHVPARVQGDAAEKLAPGAWSGLRDPFGERVLNTLERFAPGLRDLVLATHAQTPDDLFAANSNLVDGDIGSGSHTLDQQLLFRPVAGWFQHRAPLKGLYLGGASSHPGGGVHGAAGSNAARVLLLDHRAGSLRRNVRAVRHAGEVSARLRAPEASTRLLTAADGVGPLMQYDAWVLVHGTGADGLMQVVRQQLPTLVSAPFARFSRAGGPGILGVGDRLQVVMPGAGTSESEVVHVSECDFTLRTLGSHPEAGRVTIAARDAAGECVFLRVCTRTRANGWRNLVLYHCGGSFLQGRIWRTFLQRAARRAGGEVIGTVRERCVPVPEEAADVRPLPLPTIGVGGAGP